MRINIMKNILFVVLISTIISGCSLFGGRNSVNDLTQTFFVGDEGTQYFVKPLTFESDDGNELLMDITFRYKDEIKDSAVINFTIETDVLVKNPDLITISNNQDNFVTDKYELLFAEKEDKDFKSRFSIKIPMISLDKLIKNQNWVFTVDQGNLNFRYFSASSTEDALKILNDDLFVIFR